MALQCTVLVQGLRCYFIVLPCSLHLPFHLWHGEVYSQFCFAHTPFEAENGNSRGKRAKRRLDVIICQLKALEGKHMSETEIQGVIVRW